MANKFLPSDMGCYASVTNIENSLITHISDDRSAIIGKNGWCFIFEGSNNYHSAYMNKDFSYLGEEWARLIEHRQNACESANVKFLQVITPNKLTLLPEFSPQSIETEITYTLDKLIQSNCNANLLVPLQEFRDENIRESIYRRNDSHLTIAGNAYLVELILDRLGLSSYISQQVMTSTTNHVGDLGSKFNPDISEITVVPMWDKGLFDQKKIEKTKDYHVEGFNGIEQRFINKQAPINQKILVIGNSFFERVPSWGLSPFFASMFSEFHFIWSPDFNKDILINDSYDIVICQTCERFLSKLPSDCYI